MFTICRISTRRESSLYCELSHLTPAECSAVFGATHPDAYFEPERGYDGVEWLFIHHNSGEVAALYARWGTLRIGASTLVGRDLLAWLQQQFPALQARGFDPDEYQARQLAHAAIQTLTARER